MTQREIIYDIREKLKLNTDDIDVSDEYLMHLVDVKRSLLIDQRYSKFSKPIPEQFKQTICLTLENADFCRDCCLVEMRTVEELPAYHENYTSIKTKDSRAIPYNVVSEERIPFLGNNKWLKNENYAIIDADRISFYSTNVGINLLKEIKFTAIFSSPEQANELSCDKDVNCDYLDAKYPIVPSMASDIVNMIIKELAPSLNIPEDKINNADESPR